MKVIGYVRVSTQGQATDGYSLSYQEDEIKAYCKAHNCTLIQTFYDKGISGAKVNEGSLEVDREGFQDMISFIRTNEVDLVIVLNTSRLWRSDIVKVLVHRELMKQNVDIKSIEQPTYSIYNNDPSDFLINGLMELLDQYQRLEITMKLGRGRRKKAQEGGYAGGTAAYGYSSKKGSKKLTVSPIQAKVVQRTFELKKKNSSWSLQKVADQLNIEGHKTNKGKQFTKVQVKRILDREDFYKGTYQYGDVTTSQGQHKAIL